MLSSACTLYERTHRPRKQSKQSVELDVSQPWYCFAHSGSFCVSNMKQDSLATYYEFLIVSIAAA